MPGDVATFIGSLIGVSEEYQGFLLRFARDVTADSASPLYIVMMRQLLLGRGCADWSTSNLPVDQQSALVDELIDEIESGAPARARAPPTQEELAAGNEMLKEAMADMRLDDQEAKRLFARFDLDGNGTLDPKELQAIVFGLVRAARENLIATERDVDRQSQIKTGFKKVLQHYQSEEGSADMKDRFDPNGDGKVTQQEFLDALPDFIENMLAGAEGDEPMSPSAEMDPTEDLDEPIEEDEEEGADTKGKKKKKKKKEKKPKKKSKKQVKIEGEVAEALEDSDEEDIDDTGPAAEGPADGDSSPKSPKGGPAAPKGFREFFRYMTQTGGEAPRGLASVMYMAVEKHLPISVALSMQNLVVGADLDHEDCANLLGFLSRGVRTADPKQLSHAVKEYRKLTQRAWEDDAAQQASQPEDAEEAAASPKATLIRMSRGDSKIDEADVAALYDLASEVLKGSKLTAKRGAPTTLGNSGLESLLDGHWPASESASEASESAPEEVEQPPAPEPAPRGGGAIKFSNPLEDDEDAEADAPAFIEIGGAGGEDGGAMSPTSMQKYAEEFEPDYIESADISLVQLLGFQARDCCTMSAFQTLIERRALSEKELAALRSVGEAAGTEAETIDALVWLWTGGNGASDEVLKRMVAPPVGDVPGVPDPPADAQGQLFFTVVKASGLLKVDLLGKSDPFCTVRVEGHQRNTQTIKKNLNPEWEADDADAATFTFRVVNRGNAIVEVYLYDEDSDGSTKELGCVTFPLSIVSPDAELEQDFNIEPSRTMAQKRGESNLGRITLRMKFEANETQPAQPDLPTSGAVERMVASANERNLNTEVQNLLREAAAIVIARTNADLDTPKKKKKKAAMEAAGKLDPREPTLEELQESSQVKKKETKNVMGVSVALVDLAYVEDVDKKMESALKRPMAAKHMTAIAYCLAKFLDVNPAVLNVVVSPRTCTRPHYRRP